MYLLACYIMKVRNCSLLMMFVKPLASLTTLVTALSYALEWFFLLPYNFSPEQKAVVLIAKDRYLIIRYAISRFWERKSLQLI